MSKELNSSKDIRDQSKGDQKASVSHQKIEKYINDKKNLYNCILEFLEISEENDDSNSVEKCFQSLTKIVNIQNIFTDAEEVQQFLQIINDISNNHHRDAQFNQHVTKIILYYKTQIKQTLTNIEIYRLFENNKFLLLFLIKNEIISISETIYNDILYKIEGNGLRFCYFFYPELEKFIGEEEMKSVKNELLMRDSNIFDDYDNKRQIGENDSHICSLIRQDLIDEFIPYINRHNYSASSIIKPSIFETNSFLIENKNISLIEYSAFFGSIRIFQYLKMNSTELDPFLWFCSIHSKNAELIYLLELNKVLPPQFMNKYEEETGRYDDDDDYDDDENDDNGIVIEDDDEALNVQHLGSTNNYTKCLIESIKCHHNNITEYINSIHQYSNRHKQKEEIINSYIKYHNYGEFQSDNINDDEFFYLCFYNYNKLVNFLVEKDKIEYQKYDIFKKNYYF